MSACSLCPPHLFVSPLCRLHPPICIPVDAEMLIERALLISKILLCLPQFPKTPPFLCEWSLYFIISHCVSDNVFNQTSSVIWPRSGWNLLCILELPATAALPCQVMVISPSVGKGRKNKHLLCKSVIYSGFCKLS